MSAQKNNKASNRPPLERMGFIANLLKSRKHFTAKTVAQHFEVHFKTVERDLDFMRDRLGYDIQWDASAKSWFGTLPKARFL